MTKRKYYYFLVILAFSNILKYHFYLHEAIYFSIIGNNLRGSMG